MRKRDEFMRENQPRRVLLSRTTFSSLFLYKPADEKKSRLGKRRYLASDVKHTHIVTDMWTQSGTGGCSSRVKLNSRVIKFLKIRIRSENARVPFLLFPSVLIARNVPTGSRDRSYTPDWRTDSRDFTKYSSFSTVSPSLSFFLPYRDIFHRTFRDSFSPEREREREK